MLYTTLRQLEYVVAIAKAGSLTDAAQALNVSQPALSVAITQIEQRQGQKLFIRRRGAPITLSTYGQAFVVDAETLLADAARLEDPKAQASRRMQRIVVGCYEDIAPTCLAPILSHLRRSFPDVEFSSHVAGFEALATGMLDGQINLCVTYDLGLDASFKKMLLAQVMPHAFYQPGDQLSKIKNLTLNDLAHRPLILCDQGLSVRHMLGLFRTHGLLPTIAHRATSLEMMRSLAANGEGVGISYSKPPTEISYDGKPVRAMRINNLEASEPVVLVHSSPNPVMRPLPNILECILNMKNLLQVAG
jgi:DNA-binding transcriptional LysR family regulator